MAKFIIPDQCVDTISVYTLRLSRGGHWVEFQDREEFLEGGFRVTRDQVEKLFGGREEIRVVGFVDEDGTLQVFPDVEIDDQ